MKKAFLLIEPGLFFITLLFLLASCKRNDPPLVDSMDGMGTAKKMAMKVDDNEAKTLSGNLDTLWINASTFTALNPKIAFRFYDTLNSFTLHGWLGNSNNNKNQYPDARLLIGRKSIVQFGSGSYFGNLVLDAQNLRKLKKLIKANSSLFVLFAPQDPTANGGQVTYKIFLTNDDPKSPTFFSISLISTGEFTNPSPPRNDDNLPPEL